MANLKDNFLATLTSTCTIQRKTVTSTDEANQPVINWTTAQDLLVKCRLELDRNDGQEIGTGQRAVMEKDILYLPATANVTENGRVTTIVDPNGALASGTVYNIERIVPAYTQGTLHHFECFIRQLKDA